MTGKSYAKTRVILSNKTLSPLASRKSFNESAIAFKRSVNNSVSMPRLNANVSVKALASSPSKGNTDGKKRTNKGGVPGVETFPGGYRYNPNQKWEPGKVLKLHTNYYDRMNQRIQTPNWGWVDDAKTAEKKPNRPKPTIVKKKYKVNPKTNEIIEDSVVELSPFTATGAEPNNGFGTKQLPGKTIGQIMRGASLMQAAARAVGVLTDSDGKLRCPPGTPAANQFTDAMGSNCFGFTASEIYDLAQRVAHEAGHILNEVTDTTDSREGLASGGRTKQRGSLLNTVRGWRTLIGEAIEQASEIPWMSTGRPAKDLQPSDWEIDSMPDDFGWFKDGALRGRKNLRNMRARVKSLLDSYGIRQDPDNFDQNHHFIELADRMRADGIMTTEFVDRPTTREEWLNQAHQTLRAKFGDRELSKLSQQQYEELIQREIDLQFELERAMLSEFLMSYTEMPEHMRTIGALNWRPNYDMETNTEAGAFWAASGEKLDGQTAIDINLPRISDSAQEHLPLLLENERARLEAIGGGSEAENAAALHDFLVSSYVYSKQTAALIGGTESFARHIMAHEISHTVQISALIGLVADEISKNGRIRFFNRRTGKWEYKYVSSITQLSNDELNMILTQIVKYEKRNNRGEIVDSGVKKILPSLQKVIDDANKMRWLAGKYIEDVENDPDSTAVVQAFEIMAELGALRKQGIIHGPDVDDALAFMDEYVDTRFADERGISDEEETSRFLELITYAQSSTPEEVSEIFNNPLWTDERIYADSRAKAFSDIEEMDNDDNVVDFIASKEFEVEQLLEKVRENPNDTELGRALKDAKDELNKAKNKWRELNDGVDISVLQEKVKRKRGEQDKLSPQELKKRNDKRDLEKIKNHAEQASEDDIVNILASLKKKLEDPALTEESRKKLERYVDTYRKAFTKRRREAGDTRNTQAITQELNKRIKNRLNPPKPKLEETEPEAMSNPNAPKTKGKKPKPIKTPKNKAAVTRHTEKEREALFKESTARERVALVEMSDPTDKAVADLLDPEKRIDAIDRIRQANDEILSIGIEPDPTSHLQGSVEEQLENILMPVLDILERSGLQNSVEVETTIKLTPEQIDGSDSGPISVDSLISGRLVDGVKGRTTGEPGPADPETGKVAHRVVIQAEAGQRGYYPHFSETSSKEPADYQQKVVLSPGKLEIVDRIKNKDGSTTLVARVVEQKNTEEILDGILGGPDAENIQPGAKVQIQRAVNRHIVDRRKRGITSQQKTPQDEKDRIEESNNLSFDVLHSDNGSFGTQPDDEYVGELDVDADSPDSSEEEVFGPVQTREERRKERAQELADTVEKIKTVFETGEADEEIGISLDDIDPEIVAILNDSSPEEIEQMLADEAEKLHREIDARPRDVVEEEDLDELLGDEESDEEFLERMKKQRETYPTLEELLAEDEKKERARKQLEKQRSLSDLIDEAGDDDDALIRLIQDAVSAEFKEKISNKPSFPTQRRPKRPSGSDSSDSGDPSTPENKPVQPPIPPADVNPDTGEIVPTGTTPEPVSAPSQRMPLGVYFKSKYTKRRNKASSRRMQELLSRKISVEDVFAEVQALVDGTGAYQNRKSEAGMFIERHALGEFGTSDLSKLTAEQIAWLADVAIYESERIKPPNRGTRAGEIADNQSRGLSYIASALQDYLDAMYVQANGKSPYPNDDFIFSEFSDESRPRPIRGSAERLRPIQGPDSVPAGRKIQSDIDALFDAIVKTVAEQMSLPGSPGEYYLTENPLEGFDPSTASPEELYQVADLLEELLIYGQQDLPWKITPRIAALTRTISDDSRNLAGKKEQGLASGGFGGKISSRVARKLIGPIVDRIDTDEDTKERIKLVADMVAATAMKGPTGALTSIATEAARRGGREVAEIALKKLVESGKITEEQSRLAMLAVDRVAPEGLPDPVMEALTDAYQVIDKFVDERVLTDENKQRLSEAADEAKEKLIQTTEQARESVGEAAQKAKEKTRRGLARLKRNKDEMADVPDVDDVLFEAFSDPDDRFTSGPPQAPKPEVASAFDDPFASPPTSEPVDIEPPSNSGGRRITRRRRSEPTQATTQSRQLEYDPFTGGLASGRKNKIGTVNDGPVEKTTARRREGSIDSPTSYRPWMGVEVDADVHQIGDEKVYFGSDKINDESIKVLPINPYEISGFSPDSEEGQKAALLWFSATVGSMSEPNRDGGKTSALLYAASRGDSDAQAELERLAKLGDEKMKETLEDYKTFMERFDGTTREEREADGGKWWQYNYGDAMVNYTNMETYERVSRPFELKDIYMVHQTSFEPTIDADGNLVLKPAEDFDYVDPVTGEVALNPETGEPYEIYRGSVHFSLNHLVEGHIYRPTPRTGTWAVIIPAQSMIDSNPGSLENLYAVDTFLTPPPGQSLKIPAGQFKIVKLPAVDVDKDDPGYADAALAAEKRSQEIVNAALQEIGVEQTGDEFYKTPIFSPGMHGSSAGVDKRMRDLASDQGVSSTKHEGHPGAMFEQISRISKNRGVDSFTDGYTPMGYMSRNGRLRVANNNRFSNSKEKELEQDNFLAGDSGLFSGRRGRRLERVGRPESSQDFGNSTNAFDYMPTSEGQVVDIIDSNPFSRKAKKGGSKKILKAIEKAGIDWDKQRKLQDTLQKTIDESPQIGRFIEKFGMPPVFALDEMPSNGFLDTGGAWSGVAGVYLPELGIVAMPSNSRSSGRLKDDLVLRHELTHAFHFMARARSEEARELMADKYQKMTEEVLKLSKERGISPQGIIDAASYGDEEAVIAISGLTPEERAEALKISNYAATNMLEFVAEAIASASSPNPQERAKVSERALEMIAPFLGMSLSELKDILGAGAGRLI